MIGYRYCKYNDAVWRENQGGVLPLSPPSMLDQFSTGNARRLMRERGAVFLRWESNFDRSDGNPWWHIIKDSRSSLSDLSSNTRSKVRRGLKVYDCNSLSRESVLDEGYEVYSEAFSRYETHEKKYSIQEFQKAVKSMPIQTEFWGVRDKSSGALVAFSENYVERNVCFYNTIWFDPAALRKYSSYVLFFEMNRYYLEDRHMLYVSDGARSLSHETQIHDFLESKFGFRKAYAQLHVVYVPWLGALVAVAYPFRKVVSKIPFGIFQKVSILLKQEEIRRMCAKGCN